MTETATLMVRVSRPLRNQAQAIAKLRGETVSDVVRVALKEYISAALDDARDNRELDALEARIAAGQEAVFSHADVWAEIADLEARGAIPA